MLKVWFKLKLTKSVVNYKGHKFQELDDIYIIYLSGVAYEFKKETYELISVEVEK